MFDAVEDIPGDLAEMLQRVIGTGARFDSVLHQQLPKNALLAYIAVCGLDVVECEAVAQCKAHRRHKGPLSFMRNVGKGVPKHERAFDHLYNNCAAHEDAEVRITIPMSDLLF